MSWKELLFGRKEKKGDSSSGQQMPETDEKRPSRSKATSPAYIELSEDDIAPIRDVHTELSTSQMDLGRLTMDFERRKQEILDKIEQLRQEMKERVDLLRQEKGVPEGDNNYTLNLPSGPNQKAAFIRDAQFDEETGNVLEVKSNQKED